MEQSEEERYEREISNEERRISVGQTGEVAMDVQAAMLREQEEKGMREQLDFGKDIENMQYLLRGWIIGLKEDGTQGWVEPKNNDMKVLSENGVQLIINSVCFYLNKNTLLSNYDEDTILSKMEDFSTSLVDELFMSYEKYFYYPSTNDCIAVLEKRIQKRTEIRMYALKVIGVTKDSEEVKKEILKEIEARIEHELETIKEQLIKDRLKHFDMLMREVQDSVHSAYLRALNGQERRTFREHIHISENVGYKPQMGKNKSQSSYNPVSWLRR